MKDADPIHVLCTVYFYGGRRTRITSLGTPIGPLGPRSARGSVSQLRLGSRLRGRPPSFGRHVLHCCQNTLHPDKPLKLAVPCCLHRPALLLPTEDAGCRVVCSVEILALHVTEPTEVLGTENAVCRGTPSELPCISGLILRLSVEVLCSKTFRFGERASCWSDVWCVVGASRLSWLEHDGRGPQNKVPGPPIIHVTRRHLCRISCGSAYNISPNLRGPSGCYMCIMLWPAQPEALGIEISKRSCLTVHPHSIPLETGADPQYRGRVSA